MALIKCSECGKEISDKAASCPHCGNPNGANALKAIQDGLNKDFQESAKKANGCMDRVLLWFCLPAFVLSGVLWGIVTILENQPYRPRYKRSQPEVKKEYTFTPSTPREKYDYLIRNAMRTWKEGMQAIWVNLIVITAQKQKS
tara:strand:+ start:21 stop:449 length:429 start_codon:yes stop_codon:yes gene_type:complete